ncbi:MAG: GAF domain-containing protein [Leptolyngbyaceae cyanobacterium CRU_2_3]|nr:GAF domain-containing protein [Leptolyngbyaceae cyanobacterium CRU_2_3]
MSPKSTFQGSPQQSISTSENLQNTEQRITSDLPDSIWQQSDQDLQDLQDYQPREQEPEVETWEASLKPNWWGGLSVRTKASALAIVLGTVPVISIGATAYNFASRSITEQIEADKKDRAAQLANEINVYMNDRLSDVQIIGQTPIFSDPKVALATSPLQKTTLLNQYISLYGAYTSAAVFDVNGETLVQNVGDPVPNHSNEDFFNLVLQTGQPTITAPTIARATGKLSMRLAAPIKDPNTNKIEGVVRVLLPVDSLNKVAQEYGGEGDRYYVVDNTGKYFLAAGSESRLGKPAAEHFANYAQLASTEGGSVRDTDPDTGSEQLLTYVPLKNLAGLTDFNFGVLIASDTQLAFASQRQLLLTIVLGTAISTLIVAAIAADVANRGTRPILSAADAVEKIGQGDLSTRMEVYGRDEISSLGSNINNMAIRLQDALEKQLFEVQQERLLTAAKGSGVLQAEDLQDILDQAVVGAQQFLNLDRVVIYRFNTGLNAGVVSEAVGDRWSSALQNNVSDTCIPEDLLELYRQGRSVVTHDVSTSNLHPEHFNLLERLDVKSNIVVPILGGGQLFGLLIAHSCGTVRTWQEPETNFLRRLGNELGLSIYRIELLEQTTELAEEQRQLKESLQRRALELLMEVDPISRGDLTVRAKVTVDEIGTIADSYNSTVGSLRKIVLQVQEAAYQVTTTASTNEASIQGLSADALRQAEEISLALEIVKDMANTVQTVAANAEQAELAVQQAAQTVEEGDAVMNRTVDGIQVIRATVADTAKKVKHLGESSQKISKVVELISAFAAQTNMLALNASIEASRAGEEGRGFAVVANEVRSLARQSAEATEEIRKLVSNIQAETSEVVTAMESGIEQVVTGTRLVDETRQSLNKITAVSAQISELVEAIAQATVTQSQASEVVTQTMKDAAASASKTSTEASQVSASFEELRKVAQVLQEGVGQFKVG